MLDEIWCCEIRSLSVFLLLMLVKWSSSSWYRYSITELQSATCNMGSHLPPDTSEHNPP